jgi:hypothetical protein
MSLAEPSSLLLPEASPVRRRWSSLSPAAQTAVKNTIWGLALLWLLFTFAMAVIARNVIRDSENTVHNASRMAAGFVAQTMKSGQNVIDSMQQMLVANDITDAQSYEAFVSTEAMHRTLRDSVSNMKEIDKAAFISVDGRVLNFSFKYPIPPIKVQDRDYFIEQMAPGASGISVGSVALDRASGKWTFYLSRVVRAPDGRPIGMTIVGLRADFLREYLETTTLNAYTAIMLVRRDGTMLTATGVQPEALGHRFNFERGELASTGHWFQGPPAVPTTFDARNYVLGVSRIANHNLGMAVLMGDQGFWPTIFGRWAVVGLVGLITTAFVLVTLRSRLRVIVRSEEQARAEAARLARERDEAESANAAKSQFITNMSHELRTPLNGILGMLGLARGKPLDKEVRMFVETAERSADHLLAIVNDLLDLSMLEAGRCEIVERPFSPRELVENAVSIISPQATERGNSITFHVAPGVPARALGDEARLRQVLLNLLNNAVKFTEGGKVRVELWLTGHSEDAQKLRFDVSDTGLGIAHDVQAKLFQMFVQADSSIRRRFGGTGLGLAISRRLVTLMGGDIHVQSTPGKGSTFSFTVPFRPATKADVPCSPAPAQTRRLRVLAAEDVPTNQILIETLLKQDGHECVLVDNGRAAVDAMQKDHFDIVLMDVQMPEMDGVEATRRIRTLPGSAGLTPVVIVTANAMAGDEERYLGVGANAYISKPIQRRALRETLLRLAVPEDSRMADLAG